MFPKAPTFQTIMTAYPVSLSVTTLLVFIALLYYRLRAGLHICKKEKCSRTTTLLSVSKKAFRPAACPAFQT